MTNLGCQLGYTWNQLKPKQLATPVRDFLEVEPTLHLSHTF